MTASPLNVFTQFPTVGGASVSFVSATGTSVDVFAVSANLSIGTNNAGDFMVAGLTHRSDQPSITTPSGWTAIGRYNFIVAASASAPAMTLWRKSSAGSESSLTMPSTGGNLQGAGFVIVTTGQYDALSGTQSEAYFTSPLNMADVAGTTSGMRISICTMGETTASPSVGTSRLTQTSVVAYINCRVSTEPLVTTGTITGGNWATISSTGLTLSVTAKP